MVGKAGLICNPPRPLLLGSPFSSDSIGDGPGEIMSTSTSTAKSKLLGGNPAVGGRGSCLGEGEWFPYSMKCARCETHIGTCKPSNRDKRYGCYAKLDHLTKTEKEVLKKQTEREQYDGVPITNIQSTFFYQESVLKVEDSTRRSSSRVGTTNRRPSKRPRPICSQDQVAGTGVDMLNSSEAPSPSKHVNAKTHISTLTEQLRKARDKVSNLSKDKKKLQNNVAELKKELAAATEEINVLKDDLAAVPTILREKAAKFDLIPVFHKTTNNQQGGNPDGEFPVHMWAFLVGCLSTRVSCGVLRSLLHKVQLFFLPWLDNTTFQVPDDRLLNSYRASIAPACELLAGMQIAAAPRINLGIDATAVETMRGRVDTINIWATIPNSDTSSNTSTELITMAAALPQGVGTADKEVEGVVRFFGETKQKLKHLKRVLKKTHTRRAVTEMIKEVNGGVDISKIKSIMNDTAATAISTQVKLKAKVEEELQTRPWFNDLEESDKICLLMRCCHHLRNLLQTESDRWSTVRLKDILGEDAAELDQSARVELSFKSYVYALLKLFKRSGRGQYDKNSSDHIRPFFQREEIVLQFVDLCMDSNLGRIIGSRQDCIFETAWKTFTLYKALPLYCAEMIAEGSAEDGGILRKSLLIRGSSGPFMAEHFFHAVVWDMVMDPLRTIMGKDEDGQDYLALGPLFDEIYELGEKLQVDPEYLIKQMKDDSSPSLFIFGDRWKTENVKAWLEHRGKREAANVATQKKIKGTSIQASVRKMLIEYYYEDAGWGGDEDDADKALTYINKCFSDFGKALIISLERSCYPLLTKMKGIKCAKECNTCKRCTMNGMYCESNQTPAMRANASERTTHNNYAESPFAMAKELIRFFTTMNLSTIAGMTLATQNKTFEEKLEVKKASRFHELGEFNGYFYRLPKNVQLAVREVALDVKYQKEGKMRVERSIKEKEERLEELKVEATKKVDKRVLRIMNAFNVTRLKTGTELTTALKLCKKVSGKVLITKYNNVLEEQVKFRLVGCGFVYKFDTSLDKAGKGIDKTMEKMLRKMIRAENTNAGRAMYKSPSGPCVKNVYKFNVPTLGKATSLRLDIDTKIEMKGESLIDQEDDPVLLKYESDWLGVIFFDDGVDGDDMVNDKPEETRIVVEVVYDPMGKQWVVKTHVVNRDGSKKKEGQSLKEEYYIIGDNLRQMVNWHNNNLAADSLKRLEKEKKKEKKRKAAGKAGNGSKKRSRKK